MPQNVYKFRARVDREGQLRLPVPLPEGAVVEVLVLAPPVQECVDLLGAAAASADFWDNRLDDEDWNHA